MSKNTSRYTIWTWDRWVFYIQKIFSNCIRNVNNWWLGYIIRISSLIFEWFIIIYCCKKISKQITYAHFIESITRTKYQLVLVCIGTTFGVNKFVERLWNILNFWLHSLQIAVISQFISSDVISSCYWIMYIIERRAR